MAARVGGEVSLQYNRIPITAEKPPDYTDLKDLIEIVLRTSPDTPIVVNCQLGRGRSTLASVILVLLREWLQVHQPIAPGTPRIGRSLSMSTTLMEPIRASQDRYSYQVINSVPFFLLNFIEY